MEIITKFCWLALAAVHLMPSLVIFVPSMAERLYGVSPNDDVGLLIVHRGALFLGIVIACLFAAFSPKVRRAISVVVTISVVGFLWVYWRGGMPAGSFQTIAIADLVALAPLSLVTYQAWMGKLQQPQASA